jgi:Protein of unknown function (DUF664)
MTTTSDLLAEGFARIRDGVTAVLGGITPDGLTWRPDPSANSVCWLVWHLTRIQDDHLAAAFGRPQIWESEGWATRCPVPYAAGETGYGMSPEEAGRLSLPASLLAGYHEAVAARTASLMVGLTSDDLERVVDRRWDPPVSLAVRLVSVVADGLQHLGQAEYVRGLASRAGV